MLPLLVCAALASGALNPDDVAPKAATTTLTVYYRSAKGPPSAPARPLSMKDAGKPQPADLEAMGDEMSADDAKALEAADAAFYLQFETAPADLRRAVLANEKQALELARQVDGYILDSDVLRVMSWKRWETRVVGGWKGDVPQMNRQIFIAARHKGELLRAVSWGMSKFGLPDLVLDGFNKSNFDAAGRLVNLVAQSLAEGGKPAADGALALEREGKKALVVLAVGTRDENDPENRLLEIGFPGTGTHQERMGAAFVALFGAKDEIELVDPKGPDPKLTAKLPELRQRFAAGLGRAHLLLKAPFANTQGGRELMWVEVTSWKGDTIGGLLQSDPADVPALKLGSKVEIRAADVLEYAIKQGDTVLEKSY